VVGNVNFAAVKQKIRDILQAETGAGGKIDGATVLYGRKDATVEQCPVVRVFTQQAPEKPATIGGTRPNEVTLTFFVDLAAFSMKSLEDSDDALASFLENVRAILEDSANATLGGLVRYHEITNMDFDEDEQGGGHISRATITLQCTIRA